MSNPSPHRDSSASAPLAALFDAAFGPVSKAVTAGRIPGAVLGMVDLKHGTVAAALGQAARLPQPRVLTLDTWFDLASLTKVLFTTPRILAHAEAGRLDLDAPLTTLIPDLRQYDLNAWERRITFRQCLGHQTPFPATMPIYTYGSDPNLLRHFVLQHEWKAGSAAYSDINFILLGIVLERLEGRTIRDIEPGPGFSFAPPPEETAATEHCAWRGRILCGEVHDENAFALQGAGHAGLFGKVSAVLDHARGLLEANRRGDHATTLMHTALSANRAHGWERPNLGWSGGDHANDLTIGHTGFTGTGLWVDFARNRAWTLLTNRVHPTRHFDSGIFALRRDIADLVNAADLG